MDKSRKLIVAAIVVDGAGNILVTERLPDKPHPGMWEFPGGKIETGESPEQALARELREELSLSVEIGRVWDVLHHDYGDFEIVMLVYPARPTSEARCRQVADMKWLAPQALTSVDILPADAPLIKRLQHEGAPRMV